MDSTPPATCPSCGALLPEHAPQGLCPKCLFAGLAMPTDDATGVAAQMPPPAPAEVAPHFPQLEILECLGRGGMGVVYKARQKALDRFVALKLLAPERVSDPAFAERFAREAQALAKLNHPNIVTIHDFGEAGGFFYFLMEYVDGVNLRQAMKAGRFTPEQALAIVPPICDALQYAHEHGVVHRDIKPENLLLDRNGRVMIADFGIAKMLGAEGSTGLAESQPAGTPQYMAPEQRTAPGRVDHRADIYSLGVVFYEMLTGELPAGRLEAPSARMRGVHVDVRIDEIVLRALEKAPELRYQTAGEFRTQVETIVQDTKAENQAPETGDLAPKVEMPKLDSKPRFSRLAIIGACWAPLFLVTFLLYIMASKSGPGSSGPPWIYVVPAMLLLALGMTAPFGTTLLGWIAAIQIRRSAGKLYGLGLAIFDALLFPLIVLDVLINVFGALLYRVVGIAAKGTFLAQYHEVIIALLALVVFAAWVFVDYLIVRAVWRTMSASGGGASKTTPGTLHRVTRVALVSVLAALVLAVVAAVVWFNTTSRTRNDRFPEIAHIGRNNSSVLYVHEGADVHYAIYFAGRFNSSSSGSHNTHSLTWMDEGSIKLTGNGRSFGYHRESVNPDSLRINGQEYDLHQGRVFVLHDDGLVESLPLFPPYVVANDPDELAKFIAAGGPPPTPGPSEGASDAAAVPQSVLQAELEQARAELARKEASFAAGIIAAVELQTAKDKVEILKARMTGDVVRVATAQLEAARRQLELATALFQAGQLPADEFEKAKGDVVIGEAKLREAEGRKDGRGAAPARAKPNINTLGTLQTSPSGAPGKWICWAPVSETNAAALQVGQEVRLWVDAFPQRHFRGWLTTVSDTPLARENAVMYETIIDIEDPDPNFKVGMTAGAEFLSKDQAPSSRQSGSNPSSGIEPSSKTDPVSGIELKIAQQQLERALTDLQETQTQLLLLQSGKDVPGSNQQAETMKLQYRLKILQEQSARLRSLILESAPKP